MRSMSDITGAAAAADYAACRALLANGSKSFALAALLLPRRLRHAATGLYAFCRVADDLIDMTGKADAGVELVRMVKVRFPAIRTVLVTGYSDIAERAREEGFTVLRKPYDLASLMEALS